MKALLAVLLLIAWGAQAQALHQVSQTKQGLWTITMHAYVPAALKTPKAPAVVLLHGCLQGPREFFADSGWRKVADQRGWLVVVAEFDDPGEHCLWWFDPEQRRQESAAQADAIVKGLTAARKRFQVPEGENYVAGLSAGAAMAVGLLALYPDTFAAGASMAGVPFDCPRMTEEKRMMWANQPCAVPGMQELPQACACMAGDVDLSPDQWAGAVKALHPGRTTWPRISIWQGAADPVVLCRNGIETAEQWSALNGGRPPAIACPPGKSQIMSKREPAKDQRWTLAGRGGKPAVELRLLDGFGHAVPVAEGKGCGKSGKFSAEAGVCAASELADFFAAP